MSEASLWDYLKTVLPFKGHYSRIESDTSQGFPDVHYTVMGYSGTIELKFAHNPRALRPFSVRGLRKSQLDWIADEAAADGRVWICSQVGEQVFFLDGNLYWKQFNGYTVKQLEHFCEASWLRGVDIPTDLLYGILCNAVPSRVKKARQ